MRKPNRDARPDDNHPSISSIQLSDQNAIKSEKINNDKSCLELIFSNICIIWCQSISIEGCLVLANAEKWSIRILLSTSRYFKNGDRTMRRLIGFCILIAFNCSALSIAEGPKIRDLFDSDYDAAFYGTIKNSALGFALASGDINGDGLEDLIVGAPFCNFVAKNERQMQAGLVYVYFGRKSLKKTVNLSENADLVIYGAKRLNWAGFALATGDLNGDGIKDILIAAPQADSRLNKKRDNSGITYIIFGRREFPNKELDLKNSVADVELHSTQSKEYSGSALAIGDFNGDKIDDVIIGGPFSDKPKNEAGVVYLVLGRKGLKGKIDLSQNADCTIRGLKKGDRLGLALAAGDLNGDGIDDFVLGAVEADSNEKKNAGIVSVIFGRSQLPKKLDPQKDAAFTFAGSNDYDYVGTSMAVGDVNGDKIKDLVIGIPYADVLTEDDPQKQDAGRWSRKKESDAGKIAVFYGGNSLSGNRELRNGANVILLGVDGGSFADNTGAATVVADLNADGIGDLIASAPMADEKGAKKRSHDYQTTDIGAVYIKYGRRDLNAIINLEKDYDTVIYGAFRHDFLGGLALIKLKAFDFKGMADFRKGYESKVYDRFYSKSMAAGDFNGDGIADAAVAAPLADALRTADMKIDDAGAVYLFFGKRK
jgi:hypothetical protein